jgi:hypothetical protein
VHSTPTRNPKKPAASLSQSVVSSVSQPVRFNWVSGFESRKAKIINKKGKILKDRNQWRGDAYILIFMKKWEKLGSNVDLGLKSSPIEPVFRILNMLVDPDLDPRIHVSD